MLICSEKEILTKIKNREPFEAILEGGSLALTIQKYLPSICTAIHAGHRLRKELAERSDLNEQQRLHVESPATDDMISSFPITFVVLDTRIEYDLNRPLARCVHQRIWDTNVWSKPLRRSQINISHEKHKQFFRILDALIVQLERMFKACILFDIHSFNYQHLEREVPTFNIGTEQIDMDRWGGSVINYFEKKLSKITLPNLQVSTAKDELFYGRGYLTGHINSRFENTLWCQPQCKKSTWMKEQVTLSLLCSMS